MFQINRRLKENLRKPVFEIWKSNLEVIRKESLEIMNALDLSEAINKQ